MINGKLYPEFDFEIAETKIKEQLQIIKNGDFKKNDLEKVKNKVQSTLLFSRLGVLNLAMELAYFELLGDANMINDIQQNYREVSKDQIVRIANEIFSNENESCIYYKSNKNGK